MSYRATMDECNFYIKSENLNEVLKRLINSDYCQLVCDRSFTWTKEGMLDYLEIGNTTAKKSILKAFFEYKKYEADYDEDSNIVGLYHTENVWEEDTAFFAVFAELVEAGSYIVYSDEEHEIWRIYFLGEDGCEEEYGKLVFPDHSVKKPKNIRPSQLKKCIFLEWDEFTNLVRSFYPEAQQPASLSVKYTLEGIDIYSDEIEVDDDAVRLHLSEHFGVEVTSFHADDADYPCVWICYKDGSEVQ